MAVYNYRYKHGKRIYKEYTLIKYIRKEEYGRIFLVKARDGVSYALKLFSDGFKLSQNDFNILKKLDSSKVITMLELGKTVAKEPCILQEYIRHNFETVFSKKGNLRESLAVTYFREILKGIEILGNAKIIHGNLKPDNLFLQGNIVKIGNFGSIKYKSNKSSANQVFGSQEYCAPERFLKQLDFSVDRWSAVVIFFRMLTGEMPFIGDDLTQIFGAIQMEEPDYTFVPKKFHKYIKKCFKKKPQERYQSVGEMILDFENIMITSVKHDESKKYIFKKKELSSKDSVSKIEEVINGSLSKKVQKLLSLYRDRLYSNEETDFSFLLGEIFNELSKSDIDAEMNNS